MMVSLICRIKRKQAKFFSPSPTSVSVHCSNRYTVASLNTALLRLTQLALNKNFDNAISVLIVHCLFTNYTVDIFLVDLFGFRGIFIWLGYSLE